MEEVANLLRRMAPTLNHHGRREALKVADLLEDGCLSSTIVDGRIVGVAAEGYRTASDVELLRGSQAMQLLRDLDRSPYGRHEGDTEYQDPTGYSQGNPLLPAGTHIGHGLDGRLKIVVPDHVDLGKPEKWYVNEQDGSDDN